MYVLEYWLYHAKVRPEFLHYKPCLHESEKDWSPLVKEDLKAICICFPNIVHQF